MNILGLTNTEARKFFLKREQFFDAELPAYYSFEPVLGKFNSLIQHDLDISLVKAAKDCENVNHLLITNKDGRYSWRQLQIINPILYVGLVKLITKIENWTFLIERFVEYSSNEKIICVSLPAVPLNDKTQKSRQILTWWERYEQESIKLSLKFNTLTKTDVTDCYGAFYTHSIAWALHTKPVAKKGREDLSLLGNLIDTYMLAMSNGQTNGIPQGSVLMDFIAEIILGYVDLKLSAKLISISDYKIIRYRDDYSLFTNNKQDAELILKSLSESLFELGLKLNASKTLFYDNIIEGSIKQDKLFCISNNFKHNNFQKQLLLIHSISLRFPNSGSLSKLLMAYHKRIALRKKEIPDSDVLIGIVLDIAIRNPRIYPVAVAIVRELVNSTSKIDDIIELIKNKFNSIPNTDYLNIWLERLTIKSQIENSAFDATSLIINNSIWNFDWIPKGHKSYQKAITMGVFNIDIVRTLADKIDSIEYNCFEY